MIDGDTLAIDGERIRLFGIDAPEKKQLCRSGNVDWPCGQRAREALDTYATGRSVLCKGEKRDRYGRLLAVCYSQGDDINARMVRDGWALAFRRYSKVYVSEEATARAAASGLWQSEFVAPWDWRHGTRTISTE